MKNIFEIHHHRILHPVYSAYFMGQFLACAETENALAKRILDMGDDGILIPRISCSVPTGKPLLAICRISSEEYMEDWKSHSANPMPHVDWYKVSRIGLDDFTIPDYGSGDYEYIITHGTTNSKTVIKYHASSIFEIVKCGVADYMERQKDML